MKSFWQFLIQDPVRKLIALALTVVLFAVLNEGKQQNKDINADCRNRSAGFVRLRQAAARAAVS